MNTDTTTRSTGTGVSAHPAPPLPTGPLTTTAAVFWALTVAVGCLFITTSNINAVVPVILLILGAGLAWPVVQAATRARTARRAFAAGRRVEGRLSAAASRRSSVTAMGLSITTLIVLGLLTAILANDGAVQRTFLDIGFMTTSAGDITRALWINIKIAVCAQILAMILGLFLAIGRLLPGRSWAPLRLLCIGYIDAFRGIPSVVLIYLICFGLPLTGFGIFDGLPLEVLAIGALALTYAAYNAELYRAGLESINPGQTSAALSMGLGHADVFRFVLFPQMARNIAPPMLSQFIGLQKDTALVIVVGVIDAFSQAKIYAANDFNLSAVTVVCLLFVLITIPQTRIVDYMIARSGRRTGVST
ncbi:polar amino acid ABC transporter permease [Aeromicrobium sp. PE09-221]|uniref:amino acid ABC transporter permease n=1 Tax=Aeromicrobium sp. PE09-221 TaxID=1898043 RepID=UPI000B3E4F14|nr:amino acid ABC transporter permease [Aeromicrobium sp. PE09-221]OUZ12474.1 polar amino acid ABC transporter permease [Aeromicrobium sp. PE09-221]